MDFIQQSLDSDGIWTLTLNRPEKLNALSAEVLDALSDLFDRAKTDSSIRAIILTGNGKAFCAGADIKRLADCTVDTGYKFATYGQDVFRKLEQLGKPSIAAVNGYAFGGGCELLLAATIRMASHNAQFGQPEVKLGVIPGYGGTQRLSRIVGKGRAMDLCVTGRTIDAETALQWGLVTWLVDADNLIDKAREILRGVLSMAPLAVAGAMEVIDKGTDMTLPDALHLEALHFARLCGTQDKKEGVSAFLEKRKADFQGE